MIVFCSVFLPSANEVWGKVMFYTCVSFCSQSWGVCLQGGSASWGSASRGGLHPGGSAFGGGLHPKGEDPTKDTTGYGKQAGGTHPTGMHSC